MNRDQVQRWADAAPCIVCMNMAGAEAMGLTGPQAALSSTGTLLGMLQKYSLQEMVGDLCQEHRRIHDTSPLVAAPRSGS